MQPPDIGVLQVGRTAAADKFLRRGVCQQDAVVQQQNLTGNGFHVAGDVGGDCLLYTSDAADD